MGTPTIRSLVLLYAAILSVSPAASSNPAFQAGSKAFTPPPVSTDTSVLVSGRPPLTQAIVDNNVGYFSWLLEAEIPDDVRQAMQASIVADWQKKNFSAQDVATAYIKVNQLDASTQANARAKLLPQTLAAFQSSSANTVGARLFALYQATHEGKTASSTNSPVGNPNASEPSPAPGASSAPDASTGLFSLDSPPASKGGLEGLFLGYHAGYASIYSTARTHIDKMYYVFYRDGWFNSLDVDQPRKYLPGANFKAAVRAGQIPANSYGRYFPKADKLVHLTYQSGTDQDITVDPSGAAPGMEKYVPLCSCTGATFEGAYRMQNSTHFISFSRDGHFVDRGVMHDLLEYSPPYNQNADVTLAPGSGSYRIADYVLYLTYSDGRQANLMIAIPANQAQSSASIWLRNAALDRQ